ncbi:TPA: hypothetical protein ACOFEN_004633 [Bacillus cereus]|uniref:hypothetical protein n=1 Tax=Bacillus TaxID=1386 RepID=UPI001BCEBB50|nr:hypothetical protein [Bacillus toyonensis]
MYNFFIENWSSILRYGLPIVISLASFIISLITYRANKKSLDVTFEEQLMKIESISTRNFTIENKDDIYICFLKIVNPSPSDIAYFDLVVIDTHNPGNSIGIYNQLSLKMYDEDMSYYKYETSEGVANLNAPPSNYGVFKSNSFTRLDVAFTPSPTTKEVIVTFKVAIKSKIINPYANYRKNFKFYSMKYQIRDSYINN